LFTFHFVILPSDSKGRKSSPPDYGGNNSKVNLKRKYLRPTFKEGIKFIAAMST